ncbi:MAG: hypothetical protein WED04_00850 [Promethearchaeati archaeon SRVP18_Atabeyarchaeia-1]
MSQWIRKELRGGKHYPGGDEETVDNTIRDLNTEFKASFGEFSQKIFKVPKPDARRIAEKFGVPLALGLAAYQISMDGILSSDVACELLRREYLRLGKTDDAIPPIESSELDFSVKEGQWTEYLYKKFSRQVNDKTGIMTTIAGMLDSKELPLEKVVVILQERDKITRGLIAPILHKWVSSHRKTKAYQGALALAEAILQSPTKYEKLEVLSARVGEVRAILSKLKSALQAADFSSWSSREMEPLKRNISRMEDALSQMNPPVESISEAGLAELIAQLIPIRSTPPASPEKGSYLTVVSPTPRDGGLPPLLEDPYDFLERDIRLAARRDDSKEFMRKAVEKVHKVLSGDKNPPIDVALNMIMNMNDRFNGAQKLNKEEVLAKLGTFVQKQQTDDLEIIEKIDLSSLYNFLSDYLLETCGRLQCEETRPAARTRET